MSNTSKGKAEKGSKFWMQELVNKKCNDLNNAIGLGSITWISPCENDEYREYTLNSPELQKKLSETIELPEWKKVEFWPARQPQWDAIGIIDKTLILVEAKAHRNETKTNKDQNLKTEGSKSNMETIKLSMEKAFGYFKSTGHFDAWLDEYYQAGNRLAFLYYLRLTGIDTKLVFLNIANDSTNISTSEYEWRSHYENEIWPSLLGRKNPNNRDIFVIYYDVKEDYK